MDGNPEQGLCRVFNPVVAEVWGLDITDITGILTLFGTVNVTAITGDFDIESIASKLRDLDYEAALSRHMEVFTWTPTIASKHAGLLPEAIGIIRNESGSPLIILARAGNAGTAASEARIAVEASIEAYLEGTSIGNEHRIGILGIADSLGSVGSAYLTNAPAFEERMLAFDPQWPEPVRAAVGPGDLDTRSVAEPAIAIAYRRVNGTHIMEFVLGLSSTDIAMSNQSVLKRRLAGGRSLQYDLPLSDLFAAVEVWVDGPYLHATVELIGEVAQKGIFLSGIVSSQDYWFLMPGEHHSD